MSHHQSDPAFVAQFRRRWSDAPARIKLLGELSDKELGRLAVESGERIVRRLPYWLVAGLNPEERAELAGAFGRPLLRRWQERQRVSATAGKPQAQKPFTRRG
jgi:hypothetical protein